MATKGTKPYEFSGNEDAPAVPPALRALPVLVVLQHLLHMGAAVCTEEIPVQEVCTPQTPTQTHQTDVFTGQNGKQMKRVII